MKNRKCSPPHLYFRVFVSFLFTVPCAVVPFGCTELALPHSANRLRCFLSENLPSVQSRPRRARRLVGRLAARDSLIPKSLVIPLHLPTCLWKAGGCITSARTMIRSLATSRLSSFVPEKSPPALASRRALCSQRGRTGGRRGGRGCRALDETRGRSHVPGARGRDRRSVCFPAHPSIHSPLLGQKAPQRSRSRTSYRKLYEDAYSTSDLCSRAQLSLFSSCLLLGRPPQPHGKSKGGAGLGDSFVGLSVARQVAERVPLPPFLPSSNRTVCNISLTNALSCTPLRPSSFSSSSRRISSCLASLPSSSHALGVIPPSCREAEEQRTQKDSELSLPPPPPSFSSPFSSSSTPCRPTPSSSCSPPSPASSCSPPSPDPSSLPSPSPCSPTSQGSCSASSAVSARSHEASRGGPVSLSPPTPPHSSDGTREARASSACLSCASPCHSSTTWRMLQISEYTPKEHVEETPEVEGDKTLVTDRLRAKMEKQGYKIVGTHSAVKLCRYEGASGQDEALSLSSPAPHSDSPCSLPRLAACAFCFFLSFHPAAFFFFSPYFCFKLQRSSLFRASYSSGAFRVGGRVPQSSPLLEGEDSVRVHSVAVTCLVPRTALRACLPTYGYTCIYSECTGVSTEPRYSYHVARGMHLLYV